jgi:glycerol-3-phosphate cytidylyltransferase
MNTQSMTNGARVVLTYGTFDLFHIGHLNLLKNLRALGDRLVVGVSTDEFNAVKGKKTVIPYAERAAIVGALKFVDEVLPESSWDQKRSDITRANASIFAMGDDWVGKFDELSDLCEVLYLPRTKDISSTDIKAALVDALLTSKLTEISRATERVMGLVDALRPNQAQVAKFQNRRPVDSALSVESPSIKLVQFAQK